MIKVESLENIIEHKDILNHTQNKIREEREVIGENLETLEAQIIAYCDTTIEYDTLLPMTTTPSLKNALYGLYDSSEKIIQDMKDEIKSNYKDNELSHNGERCPYCGILRQSPSALDHFLPRGVFPEYSILSKNLVYICERCNNKSHKGSLVNDNDGKRLFLHPYTDIELETHTFVKCTLEFDELTVLPTFTISNEILSHKPDLYRIACNHMKKLKLNERYGALVESDLLRKFRNKFTRLDKDKKVRKYKDNLLLEDIKRFINDKIEECDETDLNNWEMIFWKEFLLSEDWFNSLAGRELEASNIETTV